MDQVAGSGDEFHETLEDITSTSSSGSADEGSGRNMRARSTKVAPATSHDRPPVWTPSTFNSKFSVWKDDTSSINERRQRFFKQMGIKNIREEPHVGIATSLLSRSLFTAGDDKGARKTVESVNDAAPATPTSTEEHETPACEKCGGERKGDVTQTCEHLKDLCLGEDLNLEVERGETSSENACKNDSSPGGTGLPTAADSYNERSAERGGAALREGKSNSGPISSTSATSNVSHKASRSGTLKSCDCPDSVDGNDPHGSHRSCEHSPGVSSNQDATIKVLASPEGSLSPLFSGGSRFESDYQHRASSSQEKLSQSYDTDYGYETRSHDGQSAIEDGMEDALMIRDLDSGKEFVINKFSTDGTLNMLREVDTGKELTLAEFEKTLGLSPVTQELRRRQRAAESRVSTEKTGLESKTGATATTKKKGWLKNLKGALVVRSSKEKPVNGGSTRSDKNYHSGDETDGSSKGGRLSRDGSSKGENSREGSFAGPDREDFSKAGGLAADENTGPAIYRQPQKVKVKLRRKSLKDLSDLHMGQEIQAHQGAIWTMKFSPDGRYLASAGQDRVVHVWEVLDHPSMADSDLWGEIGNGPTRLQCNGSVRADKDGSVKAGLDTNDKGEKDGSVKGEKDGSVKGDKDGSTKGGKMMTYRRKSGNLDSKGPAPKLFWLSDKPMCSFRGHTEDILDLSWSQTQAQSTQFLLSSSMDKTVRLWHISHEECLRVFSHNDYVTCVEFNPIDDRYFMSGSLDDKVRIWSIPDHQVVDWSDLREMVTAVCYTPDGEKAIVGSYKGTCRFYNTTGNKLQLDASVDVRTENKKGRGKKITGLHCMPGDAQKVLVTSNDSRIRVYDGLSLYAKYKGLRNVNSQISASYSPNGDYIISASEDSRVLLWSSGNRDTTKSLYRRDKQQSCEEFYSRHVSVAIAWPKPSTRLGSQPGSETPGSRSDRIGSARAASEHDLSTEDDNTEADIVEHSEEHSKCPPSCLGTTSVGIFGSGRKHDVAADEHTSSKQIESLEIYGVHHDASLGEIVSEPFTDPPILGNSQDSPPHSQVCPSFFLDNGPKGSATWPEEKLPSFGSRLSTGPALTHSASVGSDLAGRVAVEVSPVADTPSLSAAWGLVIVTAGLGGEITTFQNYGLPVRI